MKISVQARFVLSVDLVMDTVASQCELNIFDGLEHQLAVEADFHLLELLQEPDG